MSYMSILFPSKRLCFGVDEVRTGSTKHETGMRGGRRRYEWRADYKIVFHDCLPGKAWLEAHYQDNLSETSIELLVDGKSIASINGDFKRGMIKNALKPYTTKARVGRKIITIPVGEADRIAP